jgi:signal transduction histidine kinase
MDYRETTVLGRIVAEAAHDLNNVLAVTRDAGGLLKDILATVKPSKLPHPEKLQRIVESIDRQTRRGADMAKALNRFAHLTDEERAEVDLAALASLAMALTGRHASQRRTALSANHLPPGPMLEAPPMETLLAITACLRALADACPEGAIDLSTAAVEGGGEVRFALTGCKETAEPALSAPACEALGAAFSHEGDRAVLALAPPRAESA